MRKKGFSATTFVLVVLLMGALYMVSKSVTPPPAAPPEPPKEPTAVAAPANPKATQEAAQARANQMKAMMKEHAPGGKHAPPTQSTFNPDTIEVTSKYWHDAKMGSAGETELRAKVAKAKAEQAIERQKRQQMGLGAAPVKAVPSAPMSMPSPAPAPGTPGTAPATKGTAN